MNTELKEKIHKKKDFSIKSLFKVLGYSIDGMIHFYKYERSAIVYLIAAILLITLSIWLDVSTMEWFFVIFVLATILAFELVNTAIEAVCDLVSPEYNPLVKIAKDCASAATFVISVAFFCAFMALYVPRILIALGYVS